MQWHSECTLINITGQNEYDGVPNVHKQTSPPNEMHCKIKDAHELNIATVWGVLKWQTEMKCETHELAGCRNTNGNTRMRKSTENNGVITVISSLSCMNRYAKYN